MIDWNLDTTQNIKHLAAPLFLIFDKGLTEICRYTLKAVLLLNMENKMKFVSQQVEWTGYKISSMGHIWGHIDELLQQGVLIFVLMQTTLQGRLKNQHADVWKAPRAQSHSKQLLFSVRARKMLMGHSKFGGHWGFNFILFYFKKN